jgi:CheY-like chemotaxis protein
MDNEDAICTMMRARLEPEGFDLVAAAHLTEVLRLITTKTFDMLIADLHISDPIMQQGHRIPMYGGCSRYPFGRGTKSS